MFGRGPIIPGIIDPWPGKPFSPGGIFILSPGGPCIPGGGPIGGIGDDGCPCGVPRPCCWIGGFVKIDLGIDWFGSWEVGDVDLLVPRVAWGVFGEEPWEVWCDVWRGRFGVGAFGTAGVTCGDGIPVDEFCFSN